MVEKAQITTYASHPSGLSEACAIFWRWRRPEFARGLRPADLQHTRDSGGAIIRTIAVTSDVERAEAKDMVGDRESQGRCRHLDQWPVCTVDVGRCSVRSQGPTRDMRPSSLHRRSPGNRRGERARPRRRQSAARERTTGATSEILDLAPQRPRHHRQSDPDLECGSRFNRDQPCASFSMAVDRSRAWSRAGLDPSGIGKAPLEPAILDTRLIGALDSTEIPYAA